MKKCHSSQKNFFSTPLSSCILEIISILPKDPLKNFHVYRGQFTMSMVLTLIVQDCEIIFYRSFNNLRKGLGKYAGRLRWKYYSQKQIVIRTHQTDLQNLLQSETVNCELYNDLRVCVEHECLSALSKSTKCNSLAWKVHHNLASISKKNS